MLAECALVAIGLSTLLSTDSPSEAQLIAVKVNSIAREVWIYSQTGKPRRILELPLQARADHWPMAHVAGHPNGRSFLIAVDYRADFLRQFIEIGEFDLRGRRLRRFRKELKGNAGFGYDAKGIPYLGELLDDGQTALISLDAKHPAQVDPGVHRSRLEMRRVDPNWALMFPLTLPEGGANAYVSGATAPTLRIEHDRIVDLRNGNVYPSPRGSEWKLAISFGTSWLAIGREDSVDAPLRAIDSFATYAPHEGRSRLFLRAVYVCPLAANPKRPLPLDTGFAARPSSSGS